MQKANDPRPPADVHELDLLMGRIDQGADSFAALSDEQREQLKCKLADEWIAGYLDDYPVPADFVQAVRDYRAIQSGSKYPNIPANVRSDLLMHFDEQHAEGGGPEHWTQRA
jgi:hypothetical protein